VEFVSTLLSGIGALPGTLRDRSIVIVLLRAGADELKARFDSLHTEIDSILCRKLARWAQDNFAALQACDPAMPPTAFNRLADNWRPLFAIARIAGRRLAPARPRSPTALNLKTAVEPLMDANQKGLRTEVVHPSAESQMFVLISGGVPSQGQSDGSTFLGSLTFEASLRCLCFLLFRFSSLQFDAVFWRS